MLSVSCWHCESRHRHMWRDMCIVYTAQNAARHLATLQPLAPGIHNPTGRRVNAFSISVYRARKKGIFHLCLSCSIYLHIVLANRAQLFSVRRTKPVKHQRDPSNVVVGRAFCTSTYVHVCVRVRGCANGSGERNGVLRGRK